MRSLLTTLMVTLPTLTVFAQDTIIKDSLVTQPPGRSATPMFLMIGAVLIIIYFFMMRPQQKKQKETQQMLNNLKKGDKVVTIGGIHGTITGITDKIVTVKIAEKVEVDVSRTAVSHYQNQPKDSK